MVRLGQSGPGWAGRGQARHGKASQGTARFTWRVTINLGCKGWTTRDASNRHRARRVSITGWRTTREKWCGIASMSDQNFRMGAGDTNENRGQMMIEITLTIALITVIALWIVDAVILRGELQSMRALVSTSKGVVADAKTALERLLSERKIAAEYAEKLLNERGPAGLESALAIAGAGYRDAIYPLYIWLGRIHADEIRRRVAASMILHYGRSENGQVTVRAYCASPTNDHISGFSLASGGRELLRVERNDLGQVQYITIMPQQEESTDND